jgi:hypothetical protein
VLVYVAPVSEFIPFKRMKDHKSYNRHVANLIRRERLPTHAMPVLPFQRVRYWAFALMALILVVSLYLLLSTGQIIERFQGRLAAVEDSDTIRIHQYNQKLEALQDRMTAFVADSVENKLKILEKNVTEGTVGVQEIKTLEELKGEVKLLEKYSVGRKGNLTDSTRLDHARFQITPGTQNITASEDLLHEVSQMKRLLYLGIASCGFVGFLIGGYWWQTNSRIKRLSRELPLPRLLVGKVEEDL